MPTTASSLPCSLPLPDADFGLDNVNWTKGLQAMSDWIWSANLNPASFPNNLGRYFLQIPAIFEQQLAFSTTLIFDEPSFRNGQQVSGFIPRPIRELVINLIGQRRRSRYTITHHAILGTLTARKHGIGDDVYASKLVSLTDHALTKGVFSPLEAAILRFADAFATNPKSWSDEDCDLLKALLREHNSIHYAETGLWSAKLDAARAAERGALASSANQSAADKAAREAVASIDEVLSVELNARLINAQLVELAFLCLQFVALTDVFSSLNIPDENFLPAVMEGVLRPEVRTRIAALLSDDGAADPAFIPIAVDLPLKQIVDGSIEVEPAPLRGSRIPLISYEVDTGQATRDKGVSVGGVQSGAWGWSFGSYFPGGLVYLLMHHPELARFEPPYSLPLLFNEDEWRIGTQTGGFVTRRLKEIAFLKIYTSTRSRYGLEHHTMFLFNVYLDCYGVGRPPNPPLSAAVVKKARVRAIEHAEAVLLNIDSPERAPVGTYTELELATIAWVGMIVTRPHRAHELEQRLRDELAAENSREAANGTRRIDNAGGIGPTAAMQRLVDHQIAELAMLTGHMDGLGRAMTILRLESEPPVAVDDGYLTNRPGLFQAYDFVGVSAKARTANELRLNPQLVEALARGSIQSPVAADIAIQTGEF